MTLHIILEVLGTIGVLIGGFIILLIMILDESDFNVQEYLEERERQKTARKLAEIQHQRETIGTIDERQLFQGENVTTENILTENTNPDTETEHEQNNTDNT